MNETSKRSVARPVVMPEANGITVTDQPSCTFVTNGFGLAETSPSGGSSFWWSCV